MWSGGGAARRCGGWGWCDNLFVLPLSPPFFLLYLVEGWSFTCGTGGLEGGGESGLLGFIVCVFMLLASVFLIFFFSVIPRTYQIRYQPVQFSFVGSK